MNGTPRKDIVLALHREHPDWPAPKIAAHMGVCQEYVRATARRNGLTLPRALPVPTDWIAEIAGAPRPEPKPRPVRKPKPEPKAKPISIVAQRKKNVRGGIVRKPTPPKPIPVIDAKGEGITLMELARTCRWPISGERQHTLFCGRLPDFPSSYCAHHRAISRGGIECEEAA